MRTRSILGVILFLAGFVWVGQGANVITGSSMSGKPLWLIIGCVCLAAGLALMIWTWRERNAQRNSRAN